LDTSGATAAVDDPTLSCSITIGQHYNTVWYLYTPTQAATITVDTLSSNYDTILAVHTGARGSLTTVACNDDFSSLQSQVTYNASAGVAYYIEVASYAPGGGTLTLNASVSTPSTWAVKAPMGIARGWLGAAAVNGKVYVIGGNSDSFGFQPAKNGGTPTLDARFQSALETHVEVYDPSSNTWSSAASKPTGVASTGVAVINGKIYVPGGLNGSGNSRVVEVYNPATNSWSSVAPLPAALWATGVTAVNGKLYVIGGYDGSAVKNTCYVYTPAANTWSTCAALPSAREMVGTGVVNGRIYAVGGFDSGDNEQNTVSEYNPTSNTWTVKAPMPTARGGSGVVGYGNILYVCGGGWDVPLSSCVKYDVGTNSWSAFDSMNSARYALAMVQLNGKLYAEGGYYHGINSSANEENASLPVIHQISGQAGVSGATLSYGGGSTTADSSGNYSFTVPDGWSGTVTPSKAGYTFSPVNRTYTNVTVDQTGQNYIANLTATYRSVAAQDGWVVESSENSNIGRTVNSTLNIFRVGDDALNRQFRGFLSFNTASVPDNAVITSVTLRIRQQGQVGANPFATLGNIVADVKNGAFSNSNTLQIGDFQAVASKNAVLAFSNNPVNGWYSRALTPANFGYINKAGVTQFRLRFAKDDNNNHVAEYLMFCSGDYATVSYRPTLVITYYVP
jgi:N-acetylneuraminic acid mutarotase